jgi:hypothetical protein
MLVKNATPVGAVSAADFVGFSVAQCGQLNSCLLGGIDRFRQVRFGRSKAAAVNQSNRAFCGAKNLVGKSLPASAFRK